jgi:hypothetical protein
MTAILAIDPGPLKSGWVILEDKQVTAAGVWDNERLVDLLGNAAEECDEHLLNAWDDVAIEMIASYGMPVGREVFQTCVWIGRYIQASDYPDVVLLVERMQVKLTLCGNTRAKDSNVRQALIDLLGPPGTKAKPGPTYGVHGDAWAALGVAVTAAGMETGR